MSDQLEKCASVYFKEQIAARRWGLFYSFCCLIVNVVIFIVFLIAVFSKNNGVNEPHVALVKLDGTITSNANANADRIIKSLKDAFKGETTNAVILRINSPGGSPVESDDIYQQIRHLAQKYPKIPLYAVCTDICASGGYYVAAAAKYIYVNEMTITGSIGVRTGGFGFVKLLHKIGVERRLYTAGKDKAFLDPFKPKNAEQVVYMKNILTEAHEVFINAIKTGRGQRLNATNEDKMFSGMPFSGIQAKEYGLVDGFGSVATVVRDKLKDLPIYDYTESLSLMDIISYKLGHELFSKAQQLLELQLH